MASLVTALGVVLALALSVFYHGPQIPLLAAAQALIVIWVAASIIRRYQPGLDLPRSPLTVTLTLFWAWLAITLLWTPVPATSTLNFWWVGSFVLVFWAYTLAPDPDRFWRWVTRFALVGAAALCVYALVQVTVWAQPPRATFVNIHSFAALMVLVSLPTAAYFLIALNRTGDRGSAWTLGAALSLLWFTIAATQGRGTTLSLLLGFAVLIVFTWRCVPRRHVLTITALYVIAYGAANFILQGALTDRFATLSDPAGAALPRLLIWRGSWEMVKDNPWFGIGLGNYYLAWPQYRDPADTTLGFFAHNDYLQIWIEAGLPGLLLLLAVLASALYLMYRVLRDDRAAPAPRIEIVGLISGLLAVAAHSFLDFNLYILAISLTAGLVLGRWHQCVTRVVPVPSARLSLRRYLRPRAHHTVIVLLALSPLTYFAALAAAELFYQRGLTLAARAQLLESDRHLRWAENLIPSSDRFYLAHADLLRHVLRQAPKDQHDTRVALFEEIAELLNQAQTANPYRALTHDLRGRLYENAADIVGADWRLQAEGEYRQALALNPRMLQTRLHYAELLLSVGDASAARALLEDGARHWYYPEPALVAYYDSLAQLLRQAGEIAKADSFAARAAETRAAMQQLAPARPIVREAEIHPSTASAVPAGPFIAPKVR